MKDNRGFTLIELMGVLVILIILITLVSSLFTSSALKSKDRMLETLISRIETSAEKWAFDNNILRPNPGSICFQVDRFVKDGYLEPDNEKGEVLSPVDKTILNTHAVKITYTVGGVNNTQSNYTAKYSSSTNCP